VTPDDETQVPVEHLAQRLLQHARQDARLAQRTAANDDDMHSRILALPEMQHCWEPSLELPPRLGLADVGTMEALEELVSNALASAQDAEVLSQEAFDASRRARRGVIAGVALAMLGIAVAVASAMGGRLLGVQDKTADLTNQMQALSTLQHRISDQLAALQAQGATHPNDVKPAAQLPMQAPAMTQVQAQAMTPGHTMLQPLATVQVGVLPAHVAVQDNAADGKPRAGARQASWVAATGAGQGSWVASTSSAAVVDPVPPPRVWHEAEPVSGGPSYRIVMPWPAVYLIGTVRRDVHALFR
jgi:hypothetical protein